MVVSNISFIFTPILGEMMQFDEHIFQMGLVQPPTRWGVSQNVGSIIWMKEETIPREFQGFFFGVDTHKNMGGGFKYFLCSSLFGEDEPILTNIFQMG